MIVRAVIVRFLPIQDALSPEIGQEVGSCANLFWLNIQAEVAGLSRF
jgi:hypothetical protein